MTSSQIDFRAVEGGPKAALVCNKGWPELRSGPEAKPQADEAGGLAFAQVVDH